MIVLDLGSGNTCQNDIKKVEDMIDAIAYVDSGKYEVVLKWQLFHSAPPNEPLKRDVFRHAYEYAADRGYKTTASFFDVDSMNFLLDFDVPFVKIANRTDLRPMAALIDSVPIWVSYQSSNKIGRRSLVKPLCCVSAYPAPIEAYERLFTSYHLTQGISDHTDGWDLFYKYQPLRYECHFVLKQDKKNPDAGPFARTPKYLEDIL